LKHSLGSPAPRTSTSLDDLTAKCQPGHLARISDYPTSSSGPALVSYLESLLELSSKSIEAKDSAQVGHAHLPNPSASLGAILVKSTSLFRRLEQLERPADDETSSSEPTLAQASATKSADDEAQDRLMFSLSLSDGPVPVWDMQRLLALMAKQPPRHTTVGSMVTAALEHDVRAASSSSSSSQMKSLAEMLEVQMDEALGFSGRSGSEGGYVIPLSERTYPLILALRRATWWLGQGFEARHFAHIHPMVSDALARKNRRELRWLAWIRKRNRVEGRIKLNGQLWIPFHPRSAPHKTLWRRV